MSSESATRSNPGRTVRAARLMLLWVVGMDLRVTLLALPPLLPLVSRDLGLDKTAVGALTTLPVLLLGLSAAVGSALIARVGARSALVVGLCVEAVAGALRGAGPSVVVLFAATGVMGVGLAVIQPTLPTLVREWAPDAVGPTTALYGNGLLVGEALAASITLSAVLPATGSWPASLALWSAPVALAIVMAGAVAAAEHFEPSHLSDRLPVLSRDTPPALPGASKDGSARGSDDPGSDRASTSGTWPVWDARSWRLGLVLGGASSAYFTVNTFLPGYLHTIGSPKLVGPALALLNVSQLPASVLLLVFSRHLVGRRWPFLVVSGVLLMATVALLATPAPALLVPAAVVGFCTSSSLLLVLALPPLWADRREVPRLSAGMFTIGYCIAFLLPLAGGAASDVSHSARVALGPAILGAIVLGVAAARVPRRGRDVAVVS
ncbi:MAG: CynX/NimT family MFS transporter [Acidimicrobiales bacterium]